jgi:hypothetical protein
MRMHFVLVFIVSIAVFICSAAAQSLGGAGTIEGAVTDPTGAAIAGASVEFESRITGYRRRITTDASGNFRITGVPPHRYHLEISAPGFAPFAQDITVRTSVPIAVKAQLTLAAAETSVTVEAEGEHLVENVPYAHNDVDHSTLTKLPARSPGSGLSDAITLTSPGVAADSNGLFHPLGDHAQTTYSIDGQPISDQQSKQFSTQFPVNAIQSMELITGSQPAEFGDKTSLVVSAQTRSGLAQKPFGGFSVQYGSFGTIAEEGSIGSGNARAGNFLVFNALRSGRFLDTPEFWPVHAIGNNGTLFDRIDLQPSATDAFHLNLYAARNWFQVPNTYDQPEQDQRQRVFTWNIAPGYQHTFNARTLLTLNPFIRQDQVNYYPSGDLFADAPATIGESRRLLNYGIKADVSYAAGGHNVKVGTQLMQTRLRETFHLGITDPLFNPVCLDAGGEPQLLPGITDPARCSQFRFTANADLQRGLVPFDLSRGGSPFQFDGKANITQYAFYAQDSFTIGRINITGGLRVDRYDGLSEATGVQPRIGVSYQVPGPGTVLRASYSRTFETPYNENLVLSSSTGQGGLAENVFGAFGSTPIPPGRRNQFNIGVEQAVGGYFVVDTDYFWKYTDNAFDFGTLLNTPIQFPISWRKSKIDGVALRVSTPNLHGFRAMTTMGHTRSRYFGPSNGGLIFNSPLDTGVFRIDHDQAFQQTTHLHYQRPNNGPWAGFTWRYDSGLVAGAVPDIETASALTGAQQAAIGLFCGGQQATITSPITDCGAETSGATRLRIPPPGTADPDHNPPRVAPRHIFDVAVGTDNLFRTEHVRTILRFTVLNLTNKVALYNFLSTFSGTHFVNPRTYQAEVGIAF